MVSWVSLWAGPNLIPNGDFSEGMVGWNVRFPEENEQKYGENHKWVELKEVDGKAELVFNFPGKVAASEGVKAVTPLIPVSGKAEDKLEFGAELFSDAPSVIIFIEGYQEDPDQQVKGDNHYPGFVRSYRATIHVKAAKNQWATVNRVIQPFKQDRYAPSHILIKLFALHPAGTVRFRQVFLKQVDAN